ncbi:MAG: hypothetical protein H7318_16505 [Oligoflexus sp.]|nr:hypothetical protein [Oligoflexus sp.]
MVRSTFFIIGLLLASSLEAASCPYTAGTTARKAAAHHCDDLEPKARVASCRLGQELFSSKELSFDRKASCASCHLPQKDYGDAQARPELRGLGLSLSRTIRLSDVARRVAPYFWNGRAQSLEGAVFWPLYQKREMGADPETLTKFGGGTKVALALSDYLSTLNSADAAWDRYLAGDCQAMSPKAIEGAKIFHASHCENCHLGAEFSGDQVVSYHYENLPQDFFINEESRYGQDWELHTGSIKTDVTLKVKAPSLRNLYAPFGQFGQGSDLFQYLESHEKQVFTPENKSLSDTERSAIVHYLSEGLRSHPESKKTEDHL